METANPTLGQVITSEQVADLPLNGRNFVQLATLTPGTTSSTSPVSFFTSAASSEAATRGSFSLSSGGSREQETDWLLDGNDNNQLDEGGIAIFSSIDDIQEFKVLTYNYSAEYGERAGPTVLVTTKSGSNQFHGSLFEFFRNTDLDATRYFFTSEAEIQFESVWRFAGRPDQERQDVFLCRLSGQDAARGRAVHGVRSDCGDDDARRQWRLRLQQRSAWHRGSSIPIPRPMRFRRVRIRSRFPFQCYWD